MSCSSLRNRGLRQLGNDLLRNPCLKLGFIGSLILKHPRSVTAPMLLSFFVANYRYLKTYFLGHKSAPKELKPCSCIERGIATHKIPTWLLFLYPTITLPGPLLDSFQWNWYTLFTLLRTKMPRDMSSEFIRRHVPSQMSMFPEVTPPGDKIMSGASSHKRLWRGSRGCLSTRSAV